jgi:hypothetical protein
MALSIVVLSIIPQNIACFNRLHGCILMYIGFNKVGYVYETGDYYMKSTV